MLNINQKMKKNKPRMSYIVPLDRSDLEIKTPSKYQHPNESAVMSTPRWDQSFVSHHQNTMSKMSDFDQSSVSSFHQPKGTINLRGGRRAGIFPIQESRFNSQNCVQRDSKILKNLKTLTINAKLKSKVNASKLRINVSTIEEDLRKGNKADSLKIGEFSPIKFNAQFNKATEEPHTKKIWNQLLDFTKGVESEGCFQTFIAGENTKKEIKEFLKDLHKNEVIFKNHNIFKAYLIQNYLNPLIHHAKKHKKLKNQVSVMKVIEDPDFFEEVKKSMEERSLPKRYPKPKRKIKSKYRKGELIKKVNKIQKKSSRMKKQHQMSRQSSQNHSQVSRNVSVKNPQFKSSQMSLLSQFENLDMHESLSNSHESSKESSGSTNSLDSCDYTGVGAKDKETLKKIRNLIKKTSDISKIKRKNINKIGDLSLLSKSPMNQTQDLSTNLSKLYMSSDPQMKVVPEKVLPNKQKRLKVFMRNNPNLKATEANLRSGRRGNIGAFSPFSQKRKILSNIKNRNLFSPQRLNNPIFLPKTSKRGGKDKKGKKLEEITRNLNRKRGYFSP